MDWNQAFEFAKTETVLDLVTVIGSETVIRSFKFW